MALGDDPVSRGNDASQKPVRAVVVRVIAVIFGDQAYPVLQVNLLANAAIAGRPNWGVVERGEAWVVVRQLWLCSLPGKS